MSQRESLRKNLTTLVPLCLSLAAPVFAQSSETPWEHKHIKHVLLISIDGMHSVDYLNCAYGNDAVNDGAPYCPNIAALGETGINYRDAYTSKPSDSFPGLTAIVTGGSPKTEGVYYDVAYDRSLDPPRKTTGNGVAAGECIAGIRPIGTRTEYEEGIDRDQSKVNGGAPGAGLTDGTIASIDPDRLPRNPYNKCEPVWPWDFVRTNSIFTLVHEYGGFAAWSDKHPAYASVAGHGTPQALDDFYSPEINSLVIGLPGVVTPTGVACSSVVDPTQTGAWTDSFANIQCYDTLKVNGIVNQIDGLTHDGRASKVPNVFGMNFQAVSVGQKLIEGGVKGGYLDAYGTPSSVLVNEIEFVDASIGRFVAELRNRGLFESTLIIITAKHGQSPIDPNRFQPIPGHSGTNGTTPSTLIASLLPWSESPLNPTGIGPTEDDISLLWLKNQSDTGAAVDILEANAKEAGIGEILAGRTVAQEFGYPGLGPGRDPRTPDIIVTPNFGVIYTGSTKKQEEHGGFSHDDRNVMLLIANPSIRATQYFTHVETAQVAPTIMSVLGIAPNRLDAVRIEGTEALPGLNYKFE